MSPSSCGPRAQRDPERATWRRLGRRCPVMAGGSVPGGASVHRTQRAAKNAQEFSCFSPEAVTRARDTSRAQTLPPLEQALERVCRSAPSAPPSSAQPQPCGRLRCRGRGCRGRSRDGGGGGGGGGGAGGGGSEEVVEQARGARGVRGRRGQRPARSSARPRRGALGAGALPCPWSLLRRLWRVA